MKKLFPSFLLVIAALGTPAYADVFVAKRTIERSVVEAVGQPVVLAAPQHPILEEFKDFIAVPMGGAVSMDRDGDKDDHFAEDSIRSARSAAKNRSLLEKSTALGSNFLARLKSLLPKF